MTYLRLLWSFVTPTRALIAALVIAVTIQSWRVQSLEVAQAKAEGDLALANSRLESVSEQLKTQNQAIAALQAAGDAQRKAVARAEAEADRIAGDAAERVARIQKEKVPADCKAAVEWLARKADSQSHAWK